MNDLRDYYTNLLILQYKNKPNALALLQAFILPALMDQLPTQVMNAYTLGTAVGVQLDVLGKYVGVTRHSFGSNGPVTLNDADFLKLIQLAIIRNNAGSDLQSIDTLLFAYFGNNILVSDSGNMALNYSIVSTFGSSNLQSVIITQGLLPRPMGCSVSVTIIPPGKNNFFSFCTYTANAPAGTSPFNDYNFYIKNWPWGTYTQI